MPVPAMQAPPRTLAGAQVSSGSGFRFALTSQRPGA